jgi:hypothetical protein
MGWDCRLKFWTVFRLHSPLKRSLSGLIGCDWDSDLFKHKEKPAAFADLRFDLDGRAVSFHNAFAEGKPNSESDRFIFRSDLLKLAKKPF